MNASKDVPSIIREELAPDSIALIAASTFGTMPSEKLIALSSSTEISDINEDFFFNPINKKIYTEKDVFFLNERWHSFEAHSQLSSSSKVKVLQQLNNASKTTYKSLKDSSHIIITLGTSWVYRIKESGLIVANCHKVPQHKFQKELLSISEIIESLEEYLESVEIRLTTRSNLIQKPDGATGWFDAGISIGYEF